MTYLSNPLFDKYHNFFKILYRHIAENVVYYWHFPTFFDEKKIDVRSITRSDVSGKKALPPFGQHQP